MITKSSLARRLIISTRPLSKRFCVPLPLKYSRSFTHTHNSLQVRSGEPQFSPSDEQREVVKRCSRQNVVVSARPGSGKTATAEAIVAAYPDKRVAILTYSKRLQLETRHRFRNHSNCDVFTFHGMASQFFDVTVYTDAKLSELRKEATERSQLPQWNSAPYDIIILDEFQDCTELIFWLSICFIRANEQKQTGKASRLVILGDERQSIYQYRGADHRYLTLAAEIMGTVNTYSFENVALGQSFRLSVQTVRFINDAFLTGERYITSSKPGPKPIILRCHTRDNDVLAEKLASLINQHGDENCAILSPSIRQHEPFKNLINTLSERYGVQISVPIDEEAPLNDKVIEGKLCVSTIHQFKGSERDLVILSGIDSSYFKHFGRDLPDDRCPNAVFVALTRAAKQLVLIHPENKQLMPFVSVEALYKTAEVINLSKNSAKIAPPDKSGRKLKTGLTLPKSNGVRDMTRHVRDECLGEIIKRELCIRHISPPLPEVEHIKLRDIVASDSEQKFHEAVSDINGLVVVASLEHDLIGTLSTLEVGKNEMEKIPPMSSQRYVPWICRRACQYEASISGYLPRDNQMKRHKFNWIKLDDLALARNRLKDELKDSVANIRFEVRFTQDFCLDSQVIKLKGRADVMTVSSSPECNGSNKSVNSLWEIKFVSQLSNEHIAQACTYAYLSTPASEELPRTILYNVRDGQKLEITPRGGREGLRRLIEGVLRLKYTTKPKVMDEEFLQRCRGTVAEVLGLQGSRQ